MLAFFKTPLSRNAAAIFAALLAYVLAPAPWAALAFLAGGQGLALKVYGVSALLGFPAFWYLLRRGWVRFWQFLLSGLCLGVLAGVVFCVWYIFREGTIGSEPPSSLMPVFVPTLFWNVVHGVFIAATAWLVVRSVSSDLTLPSSGLPSAAAHVKR
jgi:hypothetical protein